MNPNRRYGPPGTAWRLLLALCLVLVAVSPMQAATACGGKLKYGDSITGDLAKRGATCDYTFQGNANDRVELNMVDLTPGLRPRMTLRDPSGNVVATASKRMQGIPLPVTGTYSIRIVAEKTQEPSHFTLELTKHGIAHATPAPTPAAHPIAPTPTRPRPRPTPVRTPTPPPPAVTLTPEPWTDCGVPLDGAGVQVTGQLAPGDQCSYPLDLDLSSLGESMSISVKMTSPTGELEPLAIIYDTEGDELARSEDGEASALVSFPGVYSIVAMSADGAGGAFSLDVTLRKSIPLAFICGNKLRYGRTVSNELEALGDVCQYTFYAGRPGRVITISISPTSGNLEPRLTLMNPNGDVETEEFGDIVSYRLQGTGGYSIVAGAVNDASTGAFDLTLTCEANCPP